ncbi:MAG: excalibur calcium-binding domain-containing protein [Methylovulum sp.]|nr:excalibur calcium-binding domain-containing protein [Methylovulum sp.]
MKKIIVILVLLGVGQFIYQKYESTNNVASESITEQTDETAFSEPIKDAEYKCDGRTHCSQMTSCEEAAFFLKNCPGTKMDGNQDGVPCEKQWCG